MATKKTAKKTAKKVAKKAPSKATKRKEEFSDKFGWHLDDFTVTSPDENTRIAGGKSFSELLKESGPTKKPAKGARDERHLPVGTVLRRQFKGREIEVRVTDAGFEYADQAFKSLSAVARRITGYAISGPVFFKLDEPKAAE